MELHWEDFLLLMERVKLGQSQSMTSKLEEMLMKLWEQSRPSSTLMLMELFAQLDGSQDQRQSFLIRTNRRSISRNCDDEILNRINIIIFHWWIFNNFIWHPEAHFYESNAENQYLFRLVFYEFRGIFKAIRWSFWLIESNQSNSSH